MFDKACPLNISVLLDRKNKKKKNERNHDSENIDWSLIGRWSVFSGQQRVMYLPVIDHLKR